MFVASKGLYVTMQTWQIIAKGLHVEKNKKHEKIRPALKKTLKRLNT